jgi:ppGpp synthetase/RelA/SpoT-type nucleotidyltranferase
MDKLEMQWFDSQVKEFKQVQKRYGRYAVVLQDILVQASRQLDVAAIVQVRAKTIRSYAEKILRKKDKYRDPVRQLTDLCGARVIAQTHDDVETISRFVRAHFQVDEANSLDVSERLQAAEFGYRSVHYVVQLKPNLFPTNRIRVKIPHDLYCDADQPMKAEIQVRTIAQHAWADIGHDRIYKSGFDVPKAWLRESARIAALLENADQAFERLVTAVDAYSVGRGVPIKKERLHEQSDQHRMRIREEMEILEAVRCYEDDDDQHALRIAQLATCLQEWDRIVELLRPFAERGNSALLTCLGFACCQLQKDNRRGKKFQQGRRYLEQALTADPTNLDAALYRAQSWVDLDDTKAQQYYEEAFRLDSTDPRALSGYLRLKVKDERTLSFVPLLRHNLEAAIDKCRDHAEVGVFLPEAWYYIGEFQLLLGQPYPALAAYAKAVTLSTAEFMLDAHLESLEKYLSVRHAPDELNWARLLLLLAKAARFPKKALDPRLRKLATKDARPIQAPVAIIAGGCDPSVQQQMEAYRDLLAGAFQDFQGTIVSGGTTSGISGLVGELTQQLAGRVHAIGYVPERMPADATLDSRYSEIRKTSGGDFSAREPLQSWIDLLACGVVPSQLKLLGINGGKIAAFEYQLGVAMGAKVGVVRDSGREVGKLTREQESERISGLAVLPRDRLTIKTFINHGAASALDPQIRDVLAQAIHEMYRESKRVAADEKDAAMKQWNNLAEDLRDSNRQQADQIHHKLQAIGMKAVPAADNAVKLVEFTPQQVECLAEIEHARWNVERLLAGWTCGPRDLDKKRSPYLVGWDELPEYVKDWDRAPVGAIPALLAKFGLKIQPLGT